MFWTIPFHKFVARNTYYQFEYCCIKLVCTQFVEDSLSDLFFVEQLAARSSNVTLCPIKDDSDGDKVAQLLRAVASDIHYYSSLVFHSPLDVQLCHMCRSFPVKGWQHIFMCIPCRQQLRHACQQIYWWNCVCIVGEHIQWHQSQLRLCSEETLVRSSFQ